MTAQRTLDVAGLPVGDISNQAPIWWGQFLLALTPNLGDDGLLAGLGRDKLAELFD